MTVTDKMVEAALDAWFGAAWRRRDNAADHMRIMRAALLAADREAWEPMETAPTDGSTVIVYAPPPDPEKWHETVCGLPAIICTAAYHEDAGYCVDDIREPTHWRPLPTPPIGAAPCE